MRLIISFLFFFVLNSAISQQKDALTEQEYLVLQDKIRLTANANIDSAIVFANQMAKSNNNKHLAFANAALSYLTQLEGNTNKSKEKYSLALKYLAKIPESRDKVQLTTYLYNYAGLAEWKRGNFSKALENYQEGVKLSTQIRDIVQIVKFKNNIASINDAVGNYRLAIKDLRQLNDFVDKNESVYNKEQFLNNKSNINLTLAGSYENYYMKNAKQAVLLDSAKYFYKKTISYSQNFPDNKIVAKLSLGNIYSWQKDYANAEKTYYDIIFLADQNNMPDMLCSANYNLGDLYYTTKKYDKALVFFKKTDSIAAETKSNEVDYLKSNYYQAKIYNILKEPELAYKHSKIYLDNYEKSEAKLNEEVLEVNYKLGVGDLTDEMVTIQEKYKYDVFLNKALKVFYVVLFVAIVFLLIKNIRDKNKAHKKMNALIEEFKANLEKKNLPETEEIVLDLEPEEEIHLKKENVNLSIDEAKENKIVEKLLALESKHEY